MTARPCPSCGEGMRRQALDRRPQGQVDLDMCFGCHAIWFDQYESAQLTPGAVIRLFGEIHEHHDQPPRPLGQRLRCPQCRGALALTHDVQRTNRITYYRCESGHGRLTTFVQFLREKNFVRSLTVGEVERLRAQVAQVRCSSCGGPVSVERDAQCGYCRAPISILDGDAVRRTLQELTEAERKRTQVDPAAAMDALLEGKRAERRIARIDPHSRHDPPGADFVDLVGDAIDFLMRRT